MGFKVRGAMKVLELASNQQVLDGFRMKASKSGTDLEAVAAKAGLKLEANDKVLYFRAKMMGYDLPNGNGDMVPRIYAAQFGPSFIGKQLNVNHQPDPEHIIGRILTTFHVEQPITLSAEDERIIGKNVLAGLEDAEVKELQLEGICMIDRTCSLGDDIAKKLLAGTLTMVSQEAFTEYCLCSVCGHKMQGPRSMACGHLDYGSIMVEAYQVEGKPHKVLAYKEHHNPSGEGLAIVNVGAYSKADILDLVAKAKTGAMKADEALGILAFQESVFGGNALLAAARVELASASTVENALKKLNGVEALALQKHFQAAPTIAQDPKVQVGGPAPAAPAAEGAPEPGVAPEPGTAQPQSETPTASGESLDVPKDMAPGDAQADIDKAKKDAEAAAKAGHEPAESQDDTRGPAKPDKDEKPDGEEPETAAGDAVKAAKSVSYRGYTIEPSGDNFYVKDPKGARAFGETPSSIETAKKWIDQELAGKNVKAGDDFRQLLEDANDSQLAAFMVEVEGDENGFIYKDEEAKKKAASDDDDGTGYADYYELADAGADFMIPQIMERRDLYEPRADYLDKLVRGNGSITPAAKKTQGKLKASFIKAEEAENDDEDSYDFSYSSRPATQADLEANPSIVSHYGDDYGDKPENFVVGHISDNTPGWGLSDTYLLAKANVESDGLIGALWEEFTSAKNFSPYADVPDEAFSEVPWNESFERWGAEADKKMTASLDAKRKIKAEGLREYPFDVDGKRYVAMVEYELFDGRPTWVPYEFKDESGNPVGDPRLQERLHHAFGSEESSGKVESHLYDPARDAAVDKAAGLEASATLFRGATLASSYWTLTQGAKLLGRFHLLSLAGGDLTQTVKIAGKNVNVGEHLTSELYGKDLVAHVRRFGADKVVAALAKAERQFQPALLAADTLNPDAGAVAKAADEKPAAVAEAPKDGGEPTTSDALPAQETQAGTLKAEDRYKSDEDIAKEFEGIKVTETKVWPPKPSGAKGESFQWVMLELEFPAAGEHVGGGQEGEGPHYVTEQATARLDGNGKVISVAVDNWYPENIRDWVVEEVKKAVAAGPNVDEEGHRPTASVKASDDVENAREHYARKQLGKKLDGLDDEAEADMIQNFIDTHEEEVDAYVRRTVKGEQTAEKPELRYTFAFVPHEQPEALQQLKDWAVGQNIAYEEEDRQYVTILKIPFLPDTETADDKGEQELSQLAQSLGVKTEVQKDAAVAASVHPGMFPSTPKRLLARGLAMVQRAEALDDRQLLVSLLNAGLSQGLAHTLVAGRGRLLLGEDFKSLPPLRLVKASAEAKDWVFTQVKRLRAKGKATPEQIGQVFEAAAKRGYNIQPSRWLNAGFVKPGSNRDLRELSDLGYLQLDSIEDRPSDQLNTGTRALLQSNYDAASKRLPEGGEEGAADFKTKFPEEDYPGDVVHMHGFILVYPGTKAEAEAKAISDEIDNYPLLDEEAFSNIETEIYDEDIESWAMSDAERMLGYGKLLDDILDNDELVLYDQLPDQDKAAVDAAADAPTEEVRTALYRALHDSFGNYGEAYFKETDLEGVKTAHDAAMEAINKAMSENEPGSAANMQKKEAEGQQRLPTVASLKAGSRKFLIADLEVKAATYPDGTEVQVGDIVTFMDLSSGTPVQAEGTVKSIGAGENGALVLDPVKGKGYKVAPVFPEDVIDHRSGSSTPVSANLKAYKMTFDDAVERYISKYQEETGETTTYEEVQKAFEAGDPEIVRAITEDMENDEEPEQRSEPDPEIDIVIGEDDLSAYHAGKKIVSITRDEADEDSDALYKAIAAWMDENKYFPDVWWISDHGNSNIVTPDIYKFTRDQVQAALAAKPSFKEGDRVKMKSTGKTGVLKFNMTKDRLYFEPDEAEGPWAGTFFKDEDIELIDAPAAAPEAKPERPSLGDQATAALITTELQQQLRGTPFEATADGFGFQAYWSGKMLPVTVSVKGSLMVLGAGSEAFEVQAKTPEGFENVVKELKKDDKVDNPWALANWMKSKGYKPHKKK